MRSVAVLIVRLVVGGLLAGHGAQKLFGWFGGPGLEGTAGWLESLRLRPATLWARLAGGSELGGGILTVLGFLNPLGPIAGIGAMAMAWTKVHLGKPVWVTTGGAELPLTNLAVLSALSLAGPGRLSLDGLLGIRLPRRLGAMALAAALGAVWYGSRRELAAGTSQVAETGATVEGDPSPDPQERAEVAASGTAAATLAGTSTTGTLTDFDRAEREALADAGAVSLDTPDLSTDLGIEGADESRLDDPAFPEPAFADAMTGLSGADAGTAMGSGSALGSETPDDLG